MYMYPKSAMYNHTGDLSKDGRTVDEFIKKVKCILQSRNSGSCFRGSEVTTGG